MDMKLLEVILWRCLYIGKIVRDEGREGGRESACGEFIVCGAADGCEVGSDKNVSALEKHRIAWKTNVTRLSFWY